MGDETNNNTMDTLKSNRNKRGRTGSGDEVDETIDDRYWPRFLLIKSTEDRPVSRLSPFVISKALKGLAGELKLIKKIRSGDILVECQRKGQSDNLIRTKQLADCSIEVVPHNSLNHEGVLCQNTLKCVNCGGGAYGVFQRL